ncbi:hypothetical protein KR074_011637 [Drosophila pseudoananassae]|nr:hypothetical protein KR074_011637 [Drosophila pseudoananassae]
MKACFLNLVLYIFILINFSQSRTLRIKKMQCQTLDPSFSYYKTCKVVHKENNRALLYINHVILYKEPIDDIILNLSVFKLLKTRRYQFLNETLDYCAFSRNLMSATGIIGFMINPFLNSSNINPICPLQQDDVIFNGFSIDENTLKDIPVPNGSYMLQVRTSIMKKWRADVRVHATKIERSS